MKLLLLTLLLLFPVDAGAYTVFSGSPPVSYTADNCAAVDCFCDEVGWSNCYAASELVGTYVHGSDVTTWHDAVGSNNLTESPQAAGAPKVLVGACPNNTPAVSFDCYDYNCLTGTAVLNATLDCTDVNDKCTVVIIGKWRSNLGTSQNHDIITGYRDNTNRAKIYNNQLNWRFYNGGTSRWVSPPPLGEGLTFTEFDIDTNFHSVIWKQFGDYDQGTIEESYVRAYIDEKGRQGFAGPNTYDSGVTVGASRWGSGQHINFDMCAIGFYAGDVTDDANYVSLQEYVCDKWGIGLQTVCSADTTPEITGIRSTIETTKPSTDSIELHVGATYENVNQYNPHGRMVVHAVTDGVGATWDDTIAYTAEFKEGVGGTWTTIGAATNLQTADTNPVSGVQDNNFRHWKILPDSAVSNGTVFYTRTKYVVTGSNPTTSYSDEFTVTVYTTTSTTSTTSTSSTSSTSTTSTTSTSSTSSTSTTSTTTTTTVP